MYFKTCNRKYLVTDKLYWVGTCIHTLKIDLKENLTSLDFNYVKPYLICFNLVIALGQKDFLI